MKPEKVKEARICINLKPSVFVIWLSGKILNNLQYWKSYSCVLDFKFIVNFIFNNKTTTVSG